MALRSFAVMAFAVPAFAGLTHFSLLVICLNYTDLKLGLTVGYSSIPQGNFY
jgi:hypothetical protein